MKLLRLFFVAAVLSVAATACSSPTSLDCPQGAVCHEPDSGN